jgi:hypothetical protein
LPPSSFIQAPSEQRAEVVAFDEIHHQELPAAFDEMVLDLRQRGMAQTGQRRGFALKLLAQALPVFAEEGLFDRDRGVAQVYGFGFVDRAHSTARKQTLDAIALL